MDFKLRVWDKVEGRMYDVKSVWLGSEGKGNELTVKDRETNEIKIKHMDRVELVRPTHFLLDEKIELWEGDILSNEYVRLLIEYRNEFGGFIAWYTHQDKNSWQFLSSLHGKGWKRIGDAYSWGNEGLHRDLT